MSLATAYGAAGSLALTLTWVYYSALHRHWHRYCSVFRIAALRGTSRRRETMLHPSLLRKIPILMLSLVVLVQAGAAEAAAKKKKKTSPGAATTSQTSAKKASQTSAATASGIAPPPARVAAANRQLLAYNTAAASQALGEASAEQDVWVAIARGRILEQEGNYEAAAAELRGASERGSKNPVPALFLGQTLAYAGKPTAADEAYAQAEARSRALVASNAEDAEALYYLGLSQQRLKRFGDAAANLERARELRPEDPLVHFDLGVTRFYQQNWQQASDLLSAALEKNPEIALAYYYRGLAYAKLGRKDLLHGDLDHFVKMAPNAPEAANARQILSSFR